jgi:hypothetical protein
VDDEADIVEVEGDLTEAGLNEAAGNGHYGESAGGLLAMDIGEGALSLQQRRFACK